MPIRSISAGFVAVGLLMTAPQVRAQGMQDIETYCREDIERLCKGVEPGGGRIVKCLKANKLEMSVGCAQALQKMKKQAQ